VQGIEEYVKAGFDHVYVATALSTFYPKASPLVFGLATGVGVSRVHLGRHFPSDVVVGFLIGIATGTLASWLTRLPDIL
jgi:membrane-associated phospholipid phosphatase